MAIRKRIADFLNELVRSVNLSDRLFLVNLGDCCDPSLVSSAQVLAFLDECARLRVAEPGFTPRKIVLEVCPQMTTTHPPTPRFLRIAKHAVTKPIIGALATTTSYTVFRRHHADLSVAPAMPRAMPVMPKSSKKEMRRLKRNIAQFTSHPTWFLRDATLGCADRYPSNCWVTTEGAWGPPAVPTSSPARSPADHARDELGLVDAGKDAHLLRYTFSLNPGATLGAVEMARPTFADEGNRRFRARASCVRSTAMASAGWGCTVHLGLFASPNGPSKSGRSERVTRPLEMKGLDGLNVDYLEAVTFDRANTSLDDDTAFLKEMLQTRRLVAVRNTVLRYAFPRSSASAKRAK